MKNNPNQEIHTDYRANDIFKPINANRLAESIHYDFVITQEMFDKYMEQHPTYTVVEVGKLIASNSDGTDPASYSFLAKAPVSVFIAAKIPNTVALEFTVNFITPSNNGIVDVSDFIAANGQFTAYKTDGAADIYSEYPYNVYGVSGGINFHSTPTAPITITNFLQYSGVIRIGAYRTSTTGPITVKRNGDVKVYTQELLSGYGFDDELTDSQSPGLFVADWMGSGCSGDLGYSIDEADTVQYGLYDRFAESYRLGTRASLFVRHHQSTSVYHRDHGSSYDTTFSNASEGRKIIIHKDGTITKENTGVGGGGGGGRAALVDFDTRGVITTHRYIIGDSNSIDTLSIVKPGFSAFLSPKQDMSRYASGGESSCPDWYSGYPGFSFEKGVVSTLDWFFWYAISNYEDGYSGQEAPVNWYVNPRQTLYIDIGSLVEGTVYEINLYCVKLPGADSYTIGTPSKAYGVQASPVSQHINAPTLDCDSLGVRPDIYFVNYSGNNGTYMRRWGEETRSDDNHIKPIFYNMGQPHNAGPSSSPFNNEQVRILARAKLTFTYLKGSVFVMEY